MSTEIARHPVHTPVPVPHLLLALAVAAIWGSNFVVIEIGITAMPPLLFAALRFTFAVLPAIFFLRRPPTPWRELAGYGLLVGAGMFGLISIAMKGMISPGLASLVVQTQVIFTIGLSVWLTGERIHRYQYAAVAVSLTGIALIALHRGGSITLSGLAITIAAAMSWAGGNIIASRGGKADMVAYVVWASLFSAPPLFIMSLIFEGPAAIASGLHHATIGTWCAVLWQSTGNAIFGYAAWGWLLARHPAATIVPVALLIPVFGMAAASLCLGEAMPTWKLTAAALVIGGLAINILWPRFRR